LFATVPLRRVPSPELTKEVPSAAKDAIGATNGMSAAGIAGLKLLLFMA
jgi:hypothetical protein